MATQITNGLDYYRKLATVDWKKMQAFFEDPAITATKLKIWATLEKDPIFKRSLKQLTTDEMKRRTALQMKRYLSLQFQSLETAKLPYKAKTRYLMTINEALSQTFTDLSVKLGIGVLLFKNALTTLGTERHEKILQAAWEGRIVACLAMTEIAHGSNTKQMRTTATYDKTTQEFIINTPDFQAAKCWVGNLGKTCTYGLLFAQLYTEGQCHGLHAFIVPIRDPKTLLPHPGIIVGDMGEKIALHGIDNGFIMFRDYRIPRENLLNRTADVTPEGEYESSFSEPGKILGAALQNLSAGRVSIMQECVNHLIAGVTIAVRYAALRKQFPGNSDDSNEFPIIEYQLHQSRLFPHVAAAAVFKVFVTSFTDDYLEAVERSTSTTQIEDLSNLVSEIHAIVSCSKPMISWSALDAVQQCREACGGHGFLYASRFGELRGAADACVTYEGDNNVLGQQTSNWLLRQWIGLLEGRGLNSPLGTIAFLNRHQQILARKLVVNKVEEITNLNFIVSCYEWLITYLLRETHNKQERLVQIQRKCKQAARNESQVYFASVLTKCYAEYNALVHYSKKINETDNDDLRAVLMQLGILYGLNGLYRYSIYFYEGQFTQSHQFGLFIKEGILNYCAQLKTNILAVIDALAPPDYVINSVLGKWDGKLYENLQTALFHSPGAISRPDWWQDVLIENSPDPNSIKCKL